MKRVLTDEALNSMLADDAPWGDLSTEQAGIGPLTAVARFSAREAMVCCASEEAARLFELCGAQARACVPSGARVPPGGLLLEARGEAEAVFMAWKLAQTMMEYASGIASEAARMVDALRDAGFDQPVACTRKVFPGTKALAVKAVRSGGATLHRLGLSETLLLFPEHLRFVQEPWPDLVRRLRRQQPEKKLVAEAATLDDALALARAGVDVLQLERFSPEQIRKCREALDAQGLRPVLAAAGGVKVANVVACAAAGADVLVSSAPYLAPPRDIAVLIRPGV